MNNDLVYKSYRNHSLRTALLEMNHQVSFLKQLIDQDFGLFHKIKIRTCFKFQTELVFSCPIIGPFWFSVLYWSGLLNYFFQVGLHYWLRWEFQNQILKDVQVQYCFHLRYLDILLLFRNFLYSLKDFSQDNLCLLDLGGSIFYQDFQR